MALGDYAELKALSIEVGSVFKMTLYPSDKVRPKHQGDVSRDKYFVIIGKTSDSLLVASLLINTDINGRLFNIIGPYQHCIYPSDYEFLEDKCRYVDAYAIKELSVERILQKAEYIGKLSPDDVDACVELVKASPVNSSSVLNKFNI